MISDPYGHRACPVVDAILITPALHGTELFCGSNLHNIETLKVSPNNVHTPKPPRPHLRGLHTPMPTPVWSALPPVLCADAWHRASLDPTHTNHHHPHFPLTCVTCTSSSAVRMASSLSGSALTLSWTRVLRCRGGGEGLRYRGQGRGGAQQIMYMYSLFAAYR